MIENLIYFMRWSNAMMSFVAVVWVLGLSVITWGHLVPERRHGAWVIGLLCFSDMSFSVSSLVLNLPFNPGSVPLLVANVVTLAYLYRVSLPVADQENFKME